MKSKLFILLVFVCLSTLLGYLMSRDPGYVLLSWEGHIIQTSIWLALGVIIMAVAVVHYSFKLLGGLANVGTMIQDWRGDRKRGRSQYLTSRGLLYFQEGNFKRAEKFLISGAEDHLAPTFNYIVAARTAEHRGDPVAREAYLRQALEADAKAAQAVAMAAAEMASHRGEWLLCLLKLQGIKSNSAVLNLRWRALYNAQHWPEFLALLPQLKSIINAAERLEMETRAVSCLLSTNSADVKSIYKKASAEAKQAPEVIRAYVTYIHDEKEAEKTLRLTLNQTWQPELLDLYASPDEITLPRRLKTAKGWQKKHPDDGALHHCIGRLHEAAGDRDRAKAAYEKSIRAAGSSL